MTDPFAPPTAWEHAVAVVAGVVLPLVGALQHRRAAPVKEPEPLSTREKIALYWSNSVVLWGIALLAILAWRGAGRDLDRLGLTSAPARPGLGLLLAAAFLAAYALDTWRQLSTPERLAATRARWRRDTPFMPENRREVLHSLVIVASAAVAEEIVYRGFLVGYVAAWSGRSAAGLALAVALPALVFALCHLYQGVYRAAKIALLAGLFGAILVVTGSLWIPMALHFLVDLVGSAPGPKLLAGGTEGRNAGG